MSAQNHLMLGTAYPVTTGQMKTELHPGSGAIHHHTPFSAGRRWIELDGDVIESPSQGARQGTL